MIGGELEKVIREAALKRSAMGGRICYRFLFAVGKYKQEEKRKRRE